MKTGGDMHTAAQLRRHLTMGRTILLTMGLPLFVGASLLGVMDSVRKSLLLLVGFGSVIFFHELGHFLAAKSFGIRCDVFSLGIGPRLCGWRRGVGFAFGAVPIGPRNESEQESEQEKIPATGGKKKIGETDYRLAWLPFGGYVRMLGQDDLDPSKASADPASFGKKPIWQRMVVISAGVVMNLIFAVILFAAIFRMGVKFPPAVVGSVAYNSPAQKAGLHAGDRIISIDHHKPRGFLEFTDLGVAAALDSPGRPVRLQYVRPGSARTHSVRLIPVNNPDTGLLAFGISEAPRLKIPQFTPAGLKTFVRENPEFKGLVPGAKIVSVNGVKIRSWAGLHQMIERSGGKSLRIKLVRPFPPVRTATLVLPAHLTLRDWVNQTPDILGMHPLTKIAEVLPGGAAAAAGVKKNDLVVRLGTLAYPTIHQFIKLIESSAGKPLAMIVLRGGKQTKLFVKPKISSWSIFSTPPRIGVALTPCFDRAIVGQVNKRALQAGVKPGQMLVGIALGSHATKVLPIGSWGQLVNDLGGYDGKTVVLHFANRGAPVTTAFTSAEKLGLRQFQYQIGLPLEPLLELQRSRSLVGAAIMGIDHTWRWIVRTYLTLRGLGVGTISPHQLHSVIGIAKVGYEFESRGFTYLLYFLGLISVNLAVINFLPLPILDGGLFVLLIVEKFRGKPLSVRVQTAIQVAGIALIGALFLYITIFNDLPTLFK